MGWTRITEIIEEVKLILDATSDAICIKDEVGKVIYTNAPYEVMLKRGSAEMISDVREIRAKGAKVGSVIVYHDISEVTRLKRELDRVKGKLRKVQTKYTFQDIVGTNNQLQKVIATAKVAAVTPATILLRGESGTGKEIFANAIHNASPRRNERFVKINCSSLPEDLLESELFGYKEGAFTGAQRGGKKGLFQEADHGTLFLDEIGDVSPRMQVKLLRALQEREIMPVGSAEVIEVDVRIICATNKALEEMIDRGEFREDLYYRLNVFPLLIPPLRDRKDDIRAISAYIINKYNDFYERAVLSIDQQAVEILKESDWPGNVRELENVLSRALINLETGANKLMAEDIEAALSGDSGKRKTSSNVIGQIPTEIGQAVEMTERLCIQKALGETNGDKNKAAVLLGIPLRTLYYKCTKLGI